MAEFSQTTASRWLAWIPALGWLRTYDRSWLRADVIAGLTLWGLLAPESMAYAGIAGLPPQAGLYTLLASLLIYALMGTGRHMSVGPTSATAALIASTVAAVVVTGAATSGETSVESYSAYAAAMVITVAVVFLIAGIARLGFVTQFLSKPVMDGFILGLAIFVAIGQLNKLFGVERVEGNSVEKLTHLIRELPSANWVTFAVGAAALALLFLLPRLNKTLPAGLIVLFGFILLSSVLDLHGRFGVEVIGALPRGLPTFGLPSVPLIDWLAMFAPAVGIVLLAYSEALGVAREFADRHGYEVDADQELKAHGVANLLSGLLGGMIAAGGMSASAVKEGAGARTQVSNLVAWVAIVITVLLLTPLFATLPESVLAALIIHAVWHIIAARKLQRVRLLSRTEFWLGSLAMAGVLLIDVLQGMIIGLFAALAVVVYQSSRPHVSSLGRDPAAPRVYSDNARHPQNVIIPGVLIIRLDAQLYYANALTFRGQVRALIAEAGPTLRAVVLDAEETYTLDLTSSDVLAKMLAEMQSQGLLVVVAEVHSPVADFARRSGLGKWIQKEHVFATVDDAVRYAEGAVRTAEDAALSGVELGPRGE